MRCWKVELSVLRDSESVIFSTGSSSFRPWSILAVNAIVSNNEGGSIHDILSVFSSSPRSNNEALATLLDLARTILNDPSPPFRVMIQLPGREWHPVCLPSIEPYSSWLWSLTVALGLRPWLWMGIMSLPSHQKHLHSLLGADVSVEALAMMAVHGGWSILATKHPPGKPLLRRPVMDQQPLLGQHVMLVPAGPTHSSVPGRQSLLCRVGKALPHVLVWAPLLSRPTVPSQQFVPGRQSVPGCPPVGLSLLLGLYWESSETLSPYVYHAHHYWMTWNGL